MKIVKNYASKKMYSAIPRNYQIAEHNIRECQSVDTIKNIYRVILLQTNLLIFLFYNLIKQNFQLNWSYSY